MLAPLDRLEAKGGVLRSPSTLDGVGHQNAEHTQHDVRLARRRLRKLVSHGPDLVACHSRNREGHGRALAQPADRVQVQFARSRLQCPVLRRGQIRSYQGL